MGWKDYKYARNIRGFYTRGQLGSYETKKGAIDRILEMRKAGYKVTLFREKPSMYVVSYGKVKSRKLYGVRIIGRKKGATILAR